jgi:hypothetical protein
MGSERAGDASGCVDGYDSRGVCFRLGGEGLGEEGVVRLLKALAWRVEVFVALCMSRQGGLLC